MPDASTPARREKVFDPRQGQAKSLALLAKPILAPAGSIAYFWTLRPE
jgi:hypothetical protein